ncbi:MULTISPECIES: PucR family transcriptional regulator [Actinosynnema]|uniref:PucR family transcriptional regulator n=1 Tax=Actinosynnema TaxID=40566 RepID=UPI0020A4C648|nr:PucR family transcriptional regulator [Actinosynnema pretiosum]MCP2097234.1 Purine catabolism regulatory protein-like family protein [Actinosynnema pretiosum]
MLVGDLLRMPDLRLRARTGDRWLDRPVTGARTTELTDPGRYLDGGELVLSGLHWHRADADCAPFASALVGAGASALAASRAGAGELPEALVAACLAVGLPLLEVPEDVSFGAVAERVVLELAGGAGARLAGHRRLVAAAGEGLERLVAVGAAELGAPCRVLSATGALVAGPDLPHERRAALVRDRFDAERLPVVVRRTALLPVGPRSATGWLLAVDGGSPHDATALELADLVGLERARVLRERAAATRAATPLLRALATGTGELSTRAAAAGLPEDEPLRVVMLSTSDGREALPLLEELLAPLAPDALVGVWGGGSDVGPAAGSAQAAGVRADGGLGAGGVGTGANTNPPSEGPPPAAPAHTAAQTTAAHPADAQAAVAPATAHIADTQAAAGHPAAGAQAAAGHPAADAQAATGHPAAPRTACAVLRTSTDPSPALRHALRTALPALAGRQVLIGVSSPVRAAALRGAAQEACWALELAAERGSRTEVVTAAEIPPHRLLLAAIPDQARADLRRRLLGPLLDHDAARGTDLLNTLRVFLDCSGSWTTTAARLHVHVNTLRYRVGRVEELLGVDLSRFDRRVDLFLALQTG